MNTVRLFSRLGVALIAAVFFMFFACGRNQGDTASVPLPVAWPRLPVTASDSMIPVDSLPVQILVNPQAEYEYVNGDNKGLTVTYPAVRASIYYTFIRPADPADRNRIIEARKQRISLNLNGSPATTYHDDAGNALLVVAGTTSQTPVQLLADVGPYVVTATAFIETPANAVAYDSIAPLIDVLRHDVGKSIKNLNFGQ